MLTDELGSVADASGDVVVVVGVNGPGSTTGHIVQVGDDGPDTFSYTTDPVTH